MGFAANSIRYGIVSLLAILPCWWQSRIQAGDLSSHIYNAWFANFIRTHQPAGLAVVSQPTNILFDELLSVLLALFGPDRAQRIATALAVLIFLWGAFRFAGRFGRQWPWHVLPFLLIFAYGWTFQMGLLNFYLSLGLCFWALDWALDFRRRAAIPAVLLAVLAWRAHSLPVLWSVGVLAWAFAARRLPARRLLQLGLAMAAGVAGLSVLLRRRYPTQWSVEQLSSMTGADQAWIFGAQYYLVFAGILLFWVTLAVERSRTQPFLRFFGELPVQLALLTGFTLGVMPTGILLPGYSHGLVFIAERMSLAVAVCLLAWMAGASFTRARGGIAIGLALLFFGLMYRDWAALNRLEDQVERAVAEVPRNTRVLGAIKLPASRIPAGLHMVDRACLGWCFSFSNYEPSTAQFRVRATAPNPFVTAKYYDAYAMQAGQYIARIQDGPLFEVVVRPSGAEVAVLPVGQRQTLSEISRF
ncbi:MAG: hypothetical protein NTY38_22910 [Acidobacteria bacterium]|nr:hypothetical protein [Acidobacteriota bacterium]